MAFKKDTKPGVYQFALASRPNFYTQYIDKKGKERMLLKPRNEIKDIARVLMSVKFEAFAKSYATVGKWTNPKPLGQALEIIPRTDLSNVCVCSTGKSSTWKSAQQMDSFDLMRLQVAPIFLYFMQVGHVRKQLACVGHIFVHIVEIVE